MALEVKKRYPVPHTRSRSAHKLPQRTFKREQRKKSMHRMTTSFLVLSLIAVGAGVAYTWYNGKHQVAAANQPAPERKVRPVLTPHKVASDAPIGTAIQTATPETKPGENASISVRTNAEANCSIVVKYNNVPATDSGLSPKVADEFGVISWAWTVAPSAPSGKWPIDVMCKNKKHSSVVSTEFVIKR